MTLDDVLTALHDRDAVLVVRDGSIRYIDREPLAPDDPLRAGRRRARAELVRLLAPPRVVWEPAPKRTGCWQETPASAALCVFCFRCRSPRATRLPAPSTVASSTLPSCRGSEQAAVAGGERMTVEFSTVERMTNAEAVARVTEGGRPAHNAKGCTVALESRPDGLYYYRARKRSRPCGEDVGHGLAAIEAARADEQERTERRAEADTERLALAAFDAEETMLDDLCTRTERMVQATLLAVPLPGMIAENGDADVNATTLHIDTRALRSSRRGSFSVWSSGRTGATSRRCPTSCGCSTPCRPWHDNSATWPRWRERRGSNASRVISLRRPRRSAWRPRPSEPS